MASRYVFSEEEIQELAKAAKENKKKEVDKRLRALMDAGKGEETGRGCIGDRIQF